VWSVLYNVITPTRNALDLDSHRSDKEHKHMKENEDTYMAVVEKYTLHGANTFTPKAIL